jgi:ABC-type Fe3+-hydroxamate transport system substrate-binding protein
VLETNPAWQAVRAVREHRIVVVDTLVVAFPAVRLGQAAEALARALHPELAPAR